jgi:hypothetical protein
MKIWMKIIIVIVCGGAIAGFSFGCQLKPEYAPLFASINTVLSLVSSIFAGFPAPKEA